MKQLARKRVAVAADAIATASSVEIVNYPKTESILKLLGGDNLSHRDLSQASSPQTFIKTSSIITDIQNSSCVFGVLRRQKHLRLRFSVQSESDELT